MKKGSGKILASLEEVLAELYAMEAPDDRQHHALSAAVPLLAELRGADQVAWIQGIVDKMGS